MNLIFLGPPGAGKGTQAYYVSRRLNVPHISTGDMLRSAIKNGTPTGLKAKTFMDEGKLVPDAILIEMVAERLAMPDAQNGYLLDGFPRTIEQAEALKGIRPADAVINIAVPDEALLKRLTGRRVCGKCNGTYHITTLEDATKCPECGDALIHRDDDKPETIQKRLNVYHAQTSPLIAYYEKENILLTVSGEKTPAEVDVDIMAALEQRA